MGPNRNRVIARSARMPSRFGSRSSRLGRHFIGITDCERTVISCPVEGYAASTAVTRFPSCRAAVARILYAGVRRRQIDARAIDFAKLGRLYLNQGRNGDRQVVPAAEHLYFWWIDEARGAYNAEDNCCQFIYVYPRADLVLIRNGRSCGGVYWTGFLGDVAESLESQLGE